MESDTKKKSNIEHAKDGTESEVYSFCAIGGLDDVDATLPRLLDQGYFLVFFGQVKSGAEVSGKMLLLLQRDDFENLQLEKRISDGQYFLFHADLFKGYNLKGRLNNFGFLKYDLSESIVLYGKELQIFEALFSLIAQECTSETYQANPHILISYIELLLQHMHRFYQQSFEEHADNLLALNKKFDGLLAEAFPLEEHSNKELPTLGYFANELSVTTAYLNDISLKIYGQPAQDRIDSRIIDSAKHLLATSGLSIAEIAERIGFTQPQSLNRLFKRKTKVSPMEYRILLV